MEITLVFNMSFAERGAGEYRPSPRMKSANFLVLLVAPCPQLPSVVPGSAAATPVGEDGYAL